MGLAEKLKSSKPQGSELGRISYTPGGVFDLILASVFINLLALAMPLTLLQVYDRIIPNSAEGTLILLIVGVGSALILEACLRQGRSYVSGWMGARFEHLAGVAAVERLLNVSIVDYERQGSGVHLERFNSLGPLKEFYAGQAILALCDLPFAVLFLSAMYYLAGHLVLVPIALIIVFAIAAMVVGGRLRRALESRMMADDRRYSFIIEVLGGIHTVKGLAMEEQMIRRYERLQETCATADYNVALHSSSASSTGALFSQLVLFCVVGPFLTPHDGEAQDLILGATAPSATHWFGTDTLGRDVFSRMLYGARVSLAVGFVAVGISLLIGIMLGAVAGYAGGRTDALIMRATDMVLCFPTFFLILAVIAFLEPSIWNIMIIIGNFDCYGVMTWLNIFNYSDEAFLIVPIHIHMSMICLTTSC